MKLTIDLQSTTPIYTQIRNAVIKAVADGELLAGEQLPSIRALAQALGVNLHTVNKAYAQLADEGFVQMRRGLGAVVATEMPTADLAYRQQTMPKLTAMITEAKLRKVDQATLTALIESVYGQQGMR